MGLFHQFSLVKTSESTQFRGTDLALILEIIWNVLIYSFSFFFFPKYPVICSPYCLSFSSGFCFIFFLEVYFFYPPVTDLFRFLMSFNYVVMGRPIVVTSKILSTIWTYTPVLCRRMEGFWVGNNCYHFKKLGNFTQQVQTLDF